MDIRQWQFYIARGQADARMSRGSFRHRDRLRQKRQLVVSDWTEADGAAAFALTDPLTGKTARGTVEPVAGPSGVSLRRLMLDTSAFGTNRLWVVFPSDAKEHYYGGGETFAAFDLKGHRLRVWVSEHQNAKIIAEKLIREKLTGIHRERSHAFERYESYYVQPTVVSDRGWFWHIDTGCYMEFDFRKEDKTTLMLRGNGPIYIGEAEGFPALSRGLSRLVGIQPRLPEALLDGVILASQRGTQSVENKLREADAAGLPVVGFWCQDWCGCRKTDFGYQVMWSWQWDKALYPDLPEKIRVWRERGVGFYGYANPFLATECPLYAEASRRGYCVKNARGEDYMVTITTFPAAMVDLTNPDAREWFKSILKTELIGLGMAGWMADFGEYLPTDAVLHSGEDAAELHNRWPVLWARLNREAILECGKEREVFFFSRAGFTGSLAVTPMLWNGDQHVDFSRDQGIGSVLPASLSLAMSGVGVCHSDVGGYTSIMHMKRSRELLLRWTELSCFSPLMRMHEGNRPDANVQFDHDEDLLRSVAALGRIHRRLGGYLRETLEAYYTEGTPVMRPLFYHYPEADLFRVEDEYLLGRDILVAPVLTEGQTERVCRLPDDEWIHCFTGTEYTGGLFHVAAPLGQPPVFLRKSSPWRERLIPLIAEREVAP